MTQSRKQTMEEVVINTSIGFVGSWVITYCAMLTIRDAAIAASTAVVLCTVWSLVRGYTVRRYFAMREG